MKNVLITGAGGFMGRALTDRLHRERIEVVALELPSAQTRIVAHPLTRTYSIDLSSSDALLEILNREIPDVVYHLAWAGVNSSVKDDLSIQVENIRGTLNLLQACVAARCKHVVIPGSASQFAYCGAVIDGTNTPAPGDAYAASKAATQILCQWYANQNQLNLNWLLIGSVYGPGRTDDNILTYTIKSLLQGKETRFSKLEQMWDYLYIDDLIEALFLVGEKGKKGVVYPVGSGHAMPLAEYIKIVHQKIAPDVPLGIGKLPYKQAGKPDNSVLDISKLKLDTGFVARVPFEEGIDKMIQYFEETGAL